jgi:hypothetical protein
MEWKIQAEGSVLAMFSSTWPIRLDLGFFNHFRIDRLPMAQSLSSRSRLLRAAYDNGVDARAKSRDLDAFGKLAGGTTFHTLQPVGFDLHG